MGSGAYRPRIVDSQIAEELEAIDAIEIRGAKWVGKTTTAEQFCRSAVYMNDSMRSAQNIALAKIMPAKLLEGEKPRLIDEWQMAPNIWDAVKFEADHGDGPGLFILTGSVRPNTEGIRDIGAGRFSTIVMRTMSLYESGDSTGEVSLRQLFNNQEIWGESKLDLSNVASIVVRGGWPRSCGRSDKAARTIVGAYCEALLRTNVSMPSIGSPDVCSDEEDLGNMEVSERDMEKMRRVLRSLSRNSASQVSISTILEDVNGNQKIMDRRVLSRYLKALQEIYVVEDMPAWLPKLRSKTVIRNSDTRHLSDPAIAAYFLDADADDLINDLSTFGLLFESLVVRDLRVYAQANGGKVYHYRDKDGLEADAVVHIFGGRWGAIEIKLGSQEAIDAGARTLLALRDKVSVEMNPPSFLAVVTAAGYAYTRPDGVHVIPIGCLRD